MTISSKQHRIHDYLDRHFAAIASVSGQLALIVFIVTLGLTACLALVIFSDTTLLLLQLLQWIGKDCIWCIITPT